jgi:integrase
MAALAKRKNGRRELFFKGADGLRKCIRLGVVTAKQAEVFRAKVEALIQGKRTGTTPDDEVLQWVGRLDDCIHARLAGFDLVVAREKLRPIPLAEFLADHIASLPVKPSTKKVYSRAVNDLIGFFGPGKHIGDITETDVGIFVLYLGCKAPGSKGLRKKALAPITSEKMCGIVKQFFDAAVVRKLVVSNPFAGIKIKVGKNKEREYFLSREDAQKVLDACPTAEWRLIFALARYGGLRTQSETEVLKWGDINWATGRMLVHSSKTEGHPDHESRWVPIFPELRPHLQDVFDKAEPGSEFVIARHKGKSRKWRAKMLKIISAAGLKPWPRLFNNLRATRETELCDEWPLHVACAWIGNSEKVANKHYLQITSDHWERASQENTRPGARPAAANPQDSSQLDFLDQEQNSPEPLEMAVLQPGVELCSALQNGHEGPTQVSDGLNSPSKSPTPSSRESYQRAKCAAPDAKTTPADPDLLKVYRAWPGLSATTRQAIIDLVNNSQAPPAPKAG